MTLLRIWEVARFGLLQAMSLAQQDMDKYALYFLLTDAVGCDQLFQSFALFFLINTFVQFPIQLFNGWLIDFTEDHQNLTMLSSSLVQTLAFALMFLGPQNFWFLLVIWQLRQCATMLSMTSVWKLIKLRIDVAMFNNKLRQILPEKVGPTATTAIRKNQGRRDSAASASSNSMTTDTAAAVGSGGGGGGITAPSATSIANTTNDIIFISDSTEADNDNHDSHNNNNNSHSDEEREDTKLLSSSLSDSGLAERLSISFEDATGRSSSISIPTNTKFYESTGLTAQPPSKPNQPPMPIPTLRQNRQIFKLPKKQSDPTDISLDQETAILSRVGNLGDILADTIEASCLSLIALLAKNGSRILPYLFGDWWNNRFDNTSQVNYLIVRWAVIGITLFYSTMVVLLTFSISRSYISKRASASKILKPYRSCGSLEILSSVAKILSQEAVDIPWPKLHTPTDVISIITTPTIVDLNTAEPQPSVAPPAPVPTADADAAATFVDGGMTITTVTTATTMTITTLTGSVSPHSNSTSRSDEHSPSHHTDSPLLLSNKSTTPESDDLSPVLPASDNRFGTESHEVSHDPTEQSYSTKDPDFHGVDPQQNDTYHQIAASPTTTILSKTTETPALSKSPSLRHMPFATMCCHYFYSRTRYFVTNHVTFNAMLHAFLVLFLYNLVEYPLTLLESGHTDVDPDVEKTPENFCAGQLSNLMMQGAILNCTFLVGSVFYGIFLVRCPPRIYFTFVFPSLAFILLVTIGSLWFDVTSRFAVVVFIIVSLSQVLPYYLNAFDFYVFTSSTNEHYYGFVSSIYGFGSQAIYMATGLVMTFPVLAQNMHIIIAVCLFLLVLSIIHSFYFVGRHRHLLTHNKPSIS